MISLHCRWRYTPSSKSGSKSGDKTANKTASTRDFPSTSTSSSKAFQQDFHSIKLNSASAYTDPNVASCWITDSGAANHMTNSQSCLSNTMSCTGNDQVMLGDGKFLPIEQTGDAISDTNSAQFHLNDVLYVPSIKENLISIAKFTKENSVSFEFFPWGYQIKDLETK